MLIISYFRWWYTTGWVRVGTSWRDRLKRLYLDFSVPLLITTLFAPWRRITSQGGNGLGLKLRAMVDNAVSRCVGFAVRVFALLAAAVLITSGGMVAIVTLIIWPFLPLAAILLCVRGLVV